jgi:hypothetical protein
MADQGITLCSARRNILFNHSFDHQPSADNYSFTQKKCSMKKNRKEEFLCGLEELPMEEAVAITGGESLWYWISYGIGYAGYLITNASGQQSAGQKAMNAALG